MIGVCPHCQFLPVRIWDTFVSDGNSSRLGVLSTRPTTASHVIEGANGALYHSAFAEAASQYAYDHGVVQTYSGDDLNTGNHNYPANYGHTMEIQGTVPDTWASAQDAGDCRRQLYRTLRPAEPVVRRLDWRRSSTFFRGANTTQFGGNRSISMHGPTGSTNTGKAAGAAALVISAGRSTARRSTCHPTRRARSSSRPPRT